MRFAYLLPAAALVSQAYAAATVHGVLRARQSASDIMGQIPAQCQSQCAGASDLLVGCTEGAAASSLAAQAECMCVPTAIPSLRQCFDCLLEMIEEAGAGGDELVASFEGQIESVMTDLETQCAAADLPIDGAAGAPDSATDSAAAADDDKETPESKSGAAQATVGPDADDDATADSATADSDASGASAAVVRLGALAAAAVAGALLL